MRRSFLVVAAVALAARWSVALVTERHPIFPGFYYADARLYDAQAEEYAESLRSGKPMTYRLTPGREIYTLWAGRLYARFGRVPLVPKLLNGLLSAASVGLWFLLARRLRPDDPGRDGPHRTVDRAAWTLGILLALWPTHVFYSSQNTKEAMMLASLAASFWLFLGGDPALRERKGAALGDLRPLLGTAALLFTGLLRPHFLPMACGALILGAAWRLAGSRGKPWAAGRAAWDIACLAAALALLRPVSAKTTGPFTYDEPQRQVSTFVKGLGETAELEKTTRSLGRWTPEWITSLRRARQESDQQFALKTFGRQVGSQIFQGVEFTTWADVALFLPRGAFTVLFMPLPGLYPVGGNTGRLLASLENAAILALFAAACVGCARFAGRPDRFPLAAFFLFVWLASALTEVDLGSATRHRLLYLPFLLPFASWALAEVRLPKR